MGSLVNAVTCFLKTVGASGLQPKIVAVNAEEASGCHGRSLQNSRNLIQTQLLVIMLPSATSPPQAASSHANLQCVGFF